MCWLCLSLNVRRKGSFDPKPWWFTRRCNQKYWKVSTNSCWYTWDLKHPFINSCFNWMLPNHDLKNGCLTKHPLFSLVRVPAIYIWGFRMFGASDIEWSRKGVDDVQYIAGFCTKEKSVLFGLYLSHWCTISSIKSSIGQFGWLVVFLAMAVQSVQLPILSPVPVARGNSPGSRTRRRRSTSYGLLPPDQRGVTLKELLDLLEENPEISEAETCQESICVGCHKCVA